MREAHLAFSAGGGLRTPTLSAPGLAAQLHLDALYLKAECLQVTGSFKFRGAFTKVHRVAPALNGRGVVTYSSGNHGQAVAAAAQRHGLASVVVMPEDAVAEKVAGAMALGAEVRFSGTTSVARQVTAEAIAQERDWVVIPPFDDPWVIAGQATIGLEIAEDAPDTDAVLVPIGGGGMASGISLALAQVRPHCPVFGVEPAGADDARRSLAAGELVSLDHPDTVCDGLRTSRLGQLPFAILCAHLRQVLTVSDQQAGQAVLRLLQEAKLVVEPSGAVGLAALWAGLAGETRRPTVVLSGGNISRSYLSALLAGA
jgi:threonine dehydratase